MGTTEKTCTRVTALLNRSLSHDIIEVLKSSGVDDLYLAAGRGIVLKEKKGLFGLGAGTTAVVEDPVDVLTVLVEHDAEDAILNLIASNGDLSVPGRGTVFSESIKLIKAHDLCRISSGSGASGKGASIAMGTELTGVCCIVQRGQGDIVGRVSLDTGTCVPAITFGDGTGVRDKLGLLRITIPAEKEVVNLIAGVNDADAVMNMMVDAGRLDQPGKGFIYTYPISKGLVNTKITQGMPKHAASMEQLITAVDELKGTTTWRRRSAGGSSEMKEAHACLFGLVDFTLVCNEGMGMDLVKAAMSVGAAGATISRQKFICKPQSPQSKISLSREFCNMIVGEAQIPVLIDALDKAGAFGDSAHGMVQTRPVPKACTYLGKK